jgi:PPOX class probable F420-dependent enzyme
MTANKVTIRLTEDEAWAFIESAHTGILTSLRADGMPITLPVWFVTDGRSVVFSTPSRAKKVARLRHDPRASFLVEDGEKWAELRAVHLTGHVEVIEDDDAIAAIEAAVAVKYAEFRTPSNELPDSSRARYATKTYLRLVPDDKVLSWDNRRLIR